MKTAEELRIKGLAEVSWRDDDGGGGGHCNDEIEKRSSSKISTSINSNHHHHQHHYNSTSNNNNDIITNSPIPSGAQNATLTKNNIPMPLLASPKHHIIENGSPVPTSMLTVHQQPVKKKRGRPPLDGEYDSYSTPKIAHIVECAMPPYNAVSVMLDESSQDHQQNANLQHNESGSSGGRSPKPNNGTDAGDEQTWVENNMEMHMDYEEEIHASQLIPKIERPDTPKSSDEYFENEPQSPLDDKMLSVS